MPLNLLKLCVGVSEIEELESWVKDCRAGRDTLDHVTRMFPKRKDEILPGGSLYWVIRGMILCRQPIAALEEVTGADGIARCRIVFKPQIIPVRPVPKRAFQGWRYLEEADCAARPAEIREGRGHAGEDAPRTGGTGAAVKVRRLVRGDDLDAAIELLMRFFREEGFDTPDAIIAANARLLPEVGEGGYYCCVAGAAGCPVVAAGAAGCSVVAAGAAGCSVVTAGVAACSGARAAEPAGGPADDGEDENAGGRGDADGLAVEALRRAERGCAHVRSPSISGRPCASARAGGGDGLRPVQMKKL